MNLSLQQATRLRMGSIGLLTEVPIGTGVAMLSALDPYACVSWARNP